MNFYGNAATVVGDADAVARKERDFDIIGEPAHRLVARVVENFPDEVVKAGFIGRADVHAGASANRLEAFEHCNILGSIGAFFSLLFCHMCTSKL